MGRKNIVAVVGLPSTGKSHLRRELGDVLEIRTKYCEADVDVAEVCLAADDCTSILADARAWVVVANATADAFDAMKTAMASVMDTAPDRRLLVLNETVASKSGPSVACDMVYSDGVFDWCMTHQFEAVPRAFVTGDVPSPLPTERRAALLSMRLLANEPEPIGAARVFQALACTMWTCQEKAAQFAAAEKAAAEAETEAAAAAYPSAADTSANANRVLVVYSREEGRPDDVLAALGMEGGTLAIASKYYAAEVAVHVQEVEAWAARHVDPAVAAGEEGVDDDADAATATPSSPFHGVIGVFRSEAALAKHQAHPLPTAEVGVLLGVGEALHADAQDGSRGGAVGDVHDDGTAGPQGMMDRAWSWAVANGYEVVVVPSVAEGGGTEREAGPAANEGGSPPQGLLDRMDEDATIQRVRDALEATMWPEMRRAGAGKPKKVAAAAKTATATDTPADVSANENATEEKEGPGAAVKTAEADDLEKDDRRWRNRWASGVVGAKAGCELPAGWILDKYHKKSHKLESMECRIGKRGHDVDDSDTDSGDEAEDYDTLLKEALFLRQHGRHLGPDERQERAAEVAMRMMGVR